MNALPQAALAVGTIDPVVETLEPGAVLPLDQRDTGWIVRSGAVELYAVLWQNGAAISGRHYLFTVKGGESIAPLLCGADGLMILAVATENTALLPTTLHFLSDGIGSRELRPTIVAQLDHWLHGVGTALAPIVGLMPSNAVAYPIGDE